jgi:Ras homolog gene family, member A
MPELRYFCPGIPIILVGTKSDLRSDPSIIESMTKQSTRPISESEGRKVAERIRARAYVECSARQQLGVSEVFSAAAVAAMHKNKHGHAQCRLL